MGSLVLGKMRSESQNHDHMVRKAEA